METNYIIDGEAEVWLENDAGVVEKKQMKRDDFFTVIPGRKHRVIAKTDLILQEVSTPEVDDVIRIQDDTDRVDGRLECEHKPLALCILTAGKGSRMQEYAKQINKSLLPINNKAIISYVIEKTPIETEIVVALGHKGEQVKDYCLAAHPNRRFTFVWIKDYDNPLAGPGNSLLQCKDKLQKPFYFITSDCLFEGPLPEMGNWLGVCPTSIPEIYSTVKIKDGKAVDFSNKSSDGFDHAFTGLCAIEQFDVFWDELKNNIGDSGEMVSAFYNLQKYEKMKAVQIKWHDAGTIDNYAKISGKFSEKKLGIEKPTGQFIYKINDRGVKIFQNPVSKIIERSLELKNVTPEITYQGKNVFSYVWQEGETLYEELDSLEQFLEWAYDNLWKKESNDITKHCYEFYKSKTENRKELFLQKNPEKVFLEKCIINGKKYHELQYYLDNINWQELCESPIATKIFHGDLQFDNIIKTKDGKFKLIDWRDGFGSQSIFGDAYYDLAKLYGGICMNYSLMKDEQNYSFFMDGNEITYTFKNNDKLTEFQFYFKQWASKNGFDFCKIKKLTSLIYLNMSPLHDKNLDKLLFFHSITELDKNFRKND